jgi:hypothetical protein
LFWECIGVAEQPSGLESKPQSIASRSDIELKLLENKLTVLEGRLKESENKCSAQNVKISNLQVFLCQANRSIKDQEKRNNRIKVTLVILGILFTSSMIIVGSGIIDAAVTVCNGAGSVITANSNLIHVWATISQDLQGQILTWGYSGNGMARMASKDIGGWDTMAASNGEITSSGHFSISIADDAIAGVARAFNIEKLASIKPQSKFAMLSPLWR